MAIKYDIGHVGDRIVCNNHTRFYQEIGKIIAIGDNPHAVMNHYHIYFDREIFGAIGKREIWLGRGDFEIIEFAEGVDGNGIKADSERGS